MSDAEQTRAFVQDLQSVIQRYRSEFNLTYAQVIGGLEMVKLGMFTEAMATQDGEEEG